MLQATTKVAVKPLAQLIISSLFLLPLFSFGQIDTAQIGKEITEILKKHGIKNPVFQLSITSTAQSGGQTALIINNYNGNITMVADVPYAEYAKLDMTGVPQHVGDGLIQAETDLSLLMRRVVTYPGGATKIEVIYNDTSLLYADSVTKRFPHFPYGYYCKAAISSRLHRDINQGIIACKRAIELFEITTKIEGHLGDHDRALTAMKGLLHNLETFGY